MDISRRALALLLALVVVLPLALTTLTMIAVSGWVLDRGFYQNLAGDARVYELWQEEAVPDYGNLDPTRDADRLPIGALGYALLKVAEPQYLRDQTARVIDESFDILEGKAASADVLVDIAPLKARLRGPAGATFAANLAAGLPVCSSGTEALAPGASIPRCRKPGDSTEQTADLIAAGLPAYLNRLPDQLNIANDDTRFAYRVIGIPVLVMGRLGLGMGIVVMALITGLFWVLAAFIGARSAGGRLQWLGWTLLVSAVLVGLIGPSLYGALWSGWFRYSGISSADGPYLEIFRLTMQTSTGTAVRMVANGFIITGAIASVAGLAGIVMGALAGRQQGTPRTIETEPTAVKN